MMMIACCSSKGSASWLVRWYHYHAATLLLLLLATVSKSDRYHDCSTPTWYRCGDQYYNISYPFGCQGRPDYCSHPRYYLDCEHDYTKLMIKVGEYRLYQVMNIDYDKEVLTVVDPMLIEQQPCTQSFSNITLNFQPFDSTGDVNISIFNCDDNDAPQPLLKRITCGATLSHHFYSLESEVMNRSVPCPRVALVPIREAFARSLTEDDFWTLVKGGFSLNWNEGKGWCSECLQSGGACGYDEFNLTSTDHRVCYLPDPDCFTPMPYRCGGIIYNISFPFSSPPGRPINCSNPEYNLVCDLESDMLMTNSVRYPLHVKSIDYANQVLVVADPMFAQQSCPYTFSGVVLDLSLFNYIGDVNVTLYLNCTVPDTHTLEKLHPISCLNGRLPSYYSLGENLPLECESTGIIPVSQAFESSLNDTENFWKAIEEGFNLTWMASKLMVGKDWCSDCIYEICGSDNTTANGRDCHEKNSHTKKIVIGSGILCILLAFLAFCINSYYANLSQKRKKVLINKPKSPQSVESFLENYESFAPKRYKYSEVKKMTKSFSDKLGHGGFGVVYKGELRAGLLVAVKILSGSKGNGEEFLNEVASICRTSHVNIVNLLGFCYEGSKRALIYEFMPNGSLEKFIYVERGETVPVPLGWEVLYKISIGIARGLEFLHRGCNTRIVHFDIKPHNILLDQDFCPKISVFGLAKRFPSAESRISFFGARGTAGFIAPEVFSRNFGCISSKSDVYSYGMMILEMVGGRKNVNATAANTSEIYFPHWIYDHMDQDGDLNICGVTNETVGTAKKMILVGLWCIQTLPENRPSIGRVLEMLEGSVEDMQLPPKPYLSSPSRSMGI